MSDESLHSTFSPVASHDHLISNLVRGKIVPAAIWKKREYRLKFLLRTLFYYRATRRMLDSLALRPDFAQLLSAQVTLPSKAHRQYLSRGLTSTQRAEAIVTHYQFMDTLQSPMLVHALTALEPVELVAFEGKEGTRFSILASCAHKAEREGEGTLWFCDQDNTVLASATFSVLRQHGEWQLMIGGLQGPRRDVEHDKIKLATRACYGLFPKRILLEFFGHMATHSGIKMLCGVSDNGHIFRALRYRFSKGRHFHASYDEFWMSLEATRGSRYHWQLPLLQERKSLESIPSKKRSEYRKRFALMDDIAQGCEALFPQIQR